VFGLFHRRLHRGGAGLEGGGSPSVYSLLVKRLRRHEFIIGKFLGLALTLFVKHSR